MHLPSRGTRRLQAACAAVCAASALALALLAHPALAESAPASGDVALGASIYLEGRLAAGTPIRGQREGREPVVGAAASCANCHRPSGMGQVEGDLQVPPIAGSFLFAQRGAQGVVTMDPRVSKLFNQAHDPYTDATLARAIRDGVNSQGRPMSVLMPRYALGQTEMGALIAYLRQLSTDWSAGVTRTQIEFATVITPEVEASRRKVFIDMMQTIVRQKNASTVIADTRKNRHHMVSAAELVLGTERNWNLQIWELQGPPQTWREQLEARYRSQPVFALVSGLSDASWQPVQDFCEQQRVPCWFPSVEAAGSAAGAYSLYFSNGVRLESALLAQGLSTQARRPRRLIQLCRDDALGGVAAVSLRDALAASGIEVVDRKIGPDAAAADALREALGAAKPDEAMMFWLRPGDLAALDAVEPPPIEVYFSGALARGQESLIPAAWRARSHLVFPYELPSKRRKNLEYFHAWINLRSIPLVDEPMQSEVFFAMNFLTDTLSEMLDNLYRDYLIERTEQMLSRREGSKSEQETRDRIALGREGELLSRRGPMTMDESKRVGILGRADTSARSEGTTIYAHLSLGPGQRLASKSGYIVRFAPGSGNELTPETGLMSP
jgi:hypothetical protein